MSKAEMERPEERDAIIALLRKYSHGQCQCGSRETCEACNSGSLFNRLHGGINAILSPQEATQLNDYGKSFAFKSSDLAPANAKLISAAPELLASLQDIFKFIEEVLEPAYPQVKKFFGPEYDEPLDRAKRIIKKAVGE